MELVLALVVVVAVAALIYFNRSARSLDINQDGRVDAADAVKAAENAAEGIKTTVKKAAVRAKTSAQTVTGKATRKSSTKSTASKKPRAGKK